MAKTFTGTALISYGDALPSTSLMADGALFFRTNAGVNTGLYLYGFISDNSSGTLGPQVTQNWTQVSFDPGNFVLKTGDVMTGILEVPQALRITQNSGAEQRLLIGNQTGGGLNRPGIIRGQNGVVTIGYGNSWLTTGGALTAGLAVDASLTAGLTFLGQQVWHAQNDGAGSTLDADLLDGQQGSFYQNANNINAGTLPVARGGTGITAAVDGGILYGSSTTLTAFTAAGTATSGSGTAQNWQVLASGGTGTPIWVNTTSLNAAYATAANTANSATTAASATQLTTGRNFSITGDVTAPAVSFNGTANVTLTATVVDDSHNHTFTTITGLQAALDSKVNTATTVVSDWNFFNNGSGFYRSASGATNIPAAVSMTGYYAEYSTTAGSQIAIPASSSAANQRMFIRGAASSTWGPWTEVVTTQNYQTIVGGAFVQLSGDSMSGPLSTTALGVSASVGGTGTITCSSNIISTSGFLSVNGNVNSTGGTVLAQNGDVRAGTSGGSTGWINMNIGTASRTGYLEFYDASDVRQGYIGYSATVGGGDGGTINYVGGIHHFSGSVESTGNVTAYASDIRLKTNIKPIENAVQKVQQLGGYTYDWNSEVCDLVGFKPENMHEHGLIAQQVEEVVPDAVAPAPFNHEFKTVRYDRIVALLTAAINEQQKQIDALKAEIAELKDA